MAYRYRFLVILAAFFISVLGHWGLVSWLSRLSDDVQKPAEQTAQIHFDLAFDNPTEPSVSAPAVISAPTERIAASQKPVVASSQPAVIRQSDHTNTALGKPLITEPVQQVTRQPDSSEPTARTNTQSTAQGTQHTNQNTSGGALAAGAISMIRNAGTEAGVPAAERQNAPRKQTITQTTKDIRYRQYAEDWRQKVERVGKVAFPENTNPNVSLRGRVLVRVIIRSDGSIAQLGVVQSSKNKALDAAALNIVRIAAPFSPFPDSFKNEVDLIEITRWWSFEEVFK